MKVADLKGAALDYWVSRAEGVTTIIAVRQNTGDKHPSCIEVDYKGSRITWYHPSDDWRMGGALISRLPFGIFERDYQTGLWSAGIYTDTSVAKPVCDSYQTGPTLLIAAMRAYVASKYGEEVPDESK